MTEHKDMSQETMQYQIYVKLSIYSFEFEKQYPHYYSLSMLYIPPNVLYKKGV